MNQSGHKIGRKQGKPTLGMLAIIFFCLIACTLIAVTNCNCDSEIYCRGPILEKIQMSGLFIDSKQFVDMPTSKSKAVVLLIEKIYYTLLLYFNIFQLGFEELCVFVRKFDDKAAKKFLSGKFSSSRI